MNIKYTAKAAESLRHAEDIADMLGHSYIGSEHLLIGLIQTEGCLASSILINNGVTEDKVINMVYELIAPDSSLCLKDKLDYTPRLSHILEVSSVEAARFNEKRVGTEHLLIALMKETEGVAARLLNTMGVNVKKLFKDIIVAMGRDIADFKDEFKTGQPKSKKPQMLAQYSRDLTEMAKNGKLDAVIGRQNEINRVIQILSRRTKNNPCLIGEPGVGKTAIVEGLASRIVEGDVPDTIINKRVLTLDVSGMVAGSKYRGEFEERIKKVIDEVKTDGNILLFLDELHTVIGAGGAEGAIDASNILKPSLARGEIQLIGATTLEEYRKHIEKDAALERRFQPVKVEEPTEAETVEILNGLKERYEEFHNVVILPEAIQAAAKMSKRYINDRFLPDKAIDLIDEAASKKKLSSHVKPDNIKKTEKEIKALEEEKIDSIEAGDFDTTRDIKVKLEKKKEKLDRLNRAWEKGNVENNLTIGENDIAEVVSMWTKIPVSKIQEEETERLLKLENTLHDRVIGQSEAVSAVANRTAVAAIKAVIIFFIISCF